MKQYVVLCCVKCDILVEHSMQAKERSANSSGSSDEMENDGIDLSNDIDNHPTSDHKQKSFHIDTSRIQSVPVSEQADGLQNLDLQVFNQETFEQGLLYF